MKRERPTPRTWAERLQRNLAFQYSIRCFVDLAHAAAAELADDLESACQDFAGLENQRRRLGAVTGQQVKRVGSYREKALRVFGGQEVFELATHLWVGGALPLQKRRLLGGILLARLFKQRPNPFPSLRIHGFHSNAVARAATPGRRSSVF